MDHGQFERKSRVMSQVPVEQVGPCDNLPHHDAVTAQTRNLNDTSTLQQSFAPSANEEVRGRRLFPSKPFNNNGKDEEEEQGTEEYFRRGREQDEEEDIDEVMREEEEEEESEESSSAIRCQSPDTPMTDSSYSETGSLLETPCPFSPGTSPETSSPDIPVMPPETQFPTSPLEIKQSSDKVDSRMSQTQTVALITASIQSTALAITSVTSPTGQSGPTCITEATEPIAKTTDSTTAHLTSSSEPFFNHGPASSYPGPITSTTETFTVTAHSRGLSPSISSTYSVTSGHLASVIASTTEPTSTGTESTSTTGLVTSNWEHITSLSTCSSASTWQTGTIPSPALLESLEQLAQRGDDSHLPHYLHQIAEAFVLHRDYQRALWCLQLERLYHQRVLENLNTLQEQWESQCKRTSCDLTAQHLDALKHICQTHSRPSAEDAVCGSLGFLRLLPSYRSADQVDRGTGQTAIDSSCSQRSDPVIPSSHFPDRLRFIENFDKYRTDLDRESDERDVFHGSQLTDKQGSDREGGEVEGGVGHTISAIGNGLHPSPAGEMDQSEPAEQQGGDLGLAEGKRAEREEEEKDVEKTVEVLEMEDEGEEEEKEKQKERDSGFCQKALLVDTLGSEAEVEVQQLHQEARAEEKLHEDTEDGAEAHLHQEAHPTEEAHIRQEEQLEEEEDEDYEVEQADIIREGALLDNMAKLISVEEMSPARGLVSILKKRRVCVDNMSVSVSSEHQPGKATAKRRVRFKVPDDDEQDVGSSDSCLLLFLLCLVTVVISVGGTALYCALGDAHSSVCQDFSRNADFYIGQIQRGITHVRHWYTAWS